MKDQHHLINYKVKTVGTPIKSLMPLHFKMSQVNGKDYGYFTTCGSKAIFNIYNFTDQVHVNAFEMEYGSTVWDHVVDSMGRVYMMNGSHLFCYNPYIDEFKELGRAHKENLAIFSMTIDDEDNLYIGTYPHAEIIKWDAQKEAFETLGQVDANASYARSLTYHKGSLYVATFGESIFKFYEIKLGTEFKPIEYPIYDNSSYKKEDITWLLAMGMTGDVVMIFATGQNEGQANTMFFNTITKEFIYDVWHRCRNNVSF